MKARLNLKSGAFILRCLVGFLFGLNPAARNSKASAGRRFN
jgi:hypothetical protein